MPYHAHAWRGKPPTSQQVVGALKRGEILRLTYTPSGPQYRLDPSGHKVSAQVAAQVKLDPAVASGRDGLWPGASQSWHARARLA